MVAYRFEDSRGGECVERHVAGFAGVLQIDGYAAYNRAHLREAHAGRRRAIRLTSAMTATITDTFSR